MRKINDWENVQESGSFKKLPVGGYIIGIKKVEDVESKEYLKVEWDICKGDCKNWWQSQFDKDTRNDKRWPNGGTMYRSYKGGAESMFKSFITSVEKSNKGFAWNWDESKLKNKVLGVIIAEEEYQNQKGQIRTRPYVYQVHSVETIEKGDFEVPELKKLDKDKIVESNQSKAKEVLHDPFGEASAPVEDTTSPFDTDVDPFGD